MKSQLFKLSQAVDFFFGGGMRVCGGGKVLQFSFPQ